MQRSWGCPEPRESVDSQQLTCLSWGSDDDTDPGPARPSRMPEVIGDRYERRALLGRGGMGEVWRVFDRVLRRHVALKLLLPRVAGTVELARFEEEATVAAQLQHPGIVPVHDMGSLEDGRVWFTMLEVRGRTLEKLLVEVHRAWRMGELRTAEGWSFRRLLDGFLRVCETVAYAHARGVVHRDLKPSNVMVGDFGEVLVLDWGLAKVLSEVSFERPIDLPNPSRSLTRVGAIAGTPAYMSPEQAQGRSNEAGLASDVYALGATLYDVLCERPPRVASDVQALIQQVAGHTAIRPPSHHAEGAPVDDELDRICMKALAQRAEDRYPHAGALARDLADWLDDARKREQAMARVREADEHLARVLRAEQLAAKRRAQARAALEGVPRNAPPADKEEAWRLEDQSAEHEREASEWRALAVQLLRNALSHAPELPEIHRRLAEIFHGTHVRLEAEGRAADARAVEAALREHDREGLYATYLDGRGALRLRVALPGARARLFRYVQQTRRLVRELVCELGPMDARPLEPGSYAVEVSAPGHHTALYPVALSRGETWDGVDPDGVPQPLELVPQGGLSDDECYVPAGWFRSGDDDLEHTLPARRLWCDAFAITARPVTVGAYVAYLNALIDAGREDEADEAQPRIGDSELPFYTRDAGGRFLGIRTDRDDGDWHLIPLGPDVPATCLTWAQAVAYCAWRAARDGLPWRLPMEREWQKAARGVDGRVYPWGDHFEPAWCNMVMTAETAMIADSGSFPTDISPYGVRGVAGNVCDWVADAYPESAEDAASVRVRVYRGESYRRLLVGGSCAMGPKTCRGSQRSLVHGTYRSLSAGFRLCRSISPAAAGPADPRG